MMPHRLRKHRSGDDRRHRASSPQLDALPTRHLIFTALAKGLEAGLTPEASLQSTVNKNSKLPIQAVITSLNNGKTLTETFKTHRLGSNFDISLINIGETSGRLAPVMLLIADRYHRIIDRKRRVRTKLSVPVFVGLFALIVMPIPNIVAGKLNPTQYFLYVLLIGFAAFAAWGFIRFIFMKYSTSTTGYPAYPFIGVPFLDALLEDYSTASFIERLHLLFASGFPIIEAVRLGHESLVGFARRRRYRQLEQDLHAGYSLTDTFEHHEILSQIDLPILATGEPAGRLEESLEKISRDTRARFDAKIDVLATWFPRFVYVLLTIVVAAKIL